MAPVASGVQIAPIAPPAAAQTEATGDAPSGTSREAVAAPPTATAEQWHVGIDGAPTVLSIEALRQKIEEGKVTGASLVWKPTFENWKPLSTIPELFAIVQEFQQRAAALAIHPAPARSEQVVAPAPMTNVTAPRAAETRVTVPAAPEPGLAEPVAPAPARNTATASPAAALAGTSLQPIEAKPESRRVLAVVEDDDESEVSFQLPKRAPIPIAAWFAVVIAMAFGFTLGAVVFGGKEPKEVIRYVEVPVQAKAEPTPPLEQAKPPELQEVATAEPTASSQSPLKGASRAAGESAPASTGKPGGLLAGLNGLRANAPSAGPTAGGDTSNTQQPVGGAQLDASSIQRTVSNYVPGVRRGCWQPALDARTPDAPSSARVVATITVGPSGDVQNVTSTGDPRGYSGLARCIETRVRGWKFPAGSGTTTANVPFVFAAQ